MLPHELEEIESDSFDVPMRTLESESDSFDDSRFAISPDMLD
jgi:hypothetical protein